MLNNESMPKSTVIPVLGYADVRRAVDWLTAAFGFTERLRIGDHRAQLTFGNGDIVIAKAAGSDVPAGHSIMIRVANVDAHFERAQQAGAKLLGKPETFPYGERQYSAADIDGHIWTFSQTVADVNPGSWGGILNVDND